MTLPEIKIVFYVALQGRIKNNKYKLKKNRLYISMSPNNRNL